MYSENTFNENDIDRLRGAVAHDPDGERIGNVSEVYLDDETGRPMWVTVNTGLFGMHTSFVPLAGSNLDGDGNLVLAHDKAVVKDAPRMAEDGHLDRAQEDELYRYYGVAGGDVAADTMRTRRWAGDAHEEDSVFDRDHDGRGPVGEVLDGPDGTSGDRRGDQGLDPHANVGYAADTADVRGDGELYNRGVAEDGSGSLFDRDRDGRGPVGEVIDGPDDGRHGDRRDDGSLFDRDRDGRGPIEEVIDGPDDPRNPRRN